MLSYADKEGARNFLSQETLMSKVSSLQVDIYGGHDPREIPAYRFVDAAIYLNIPVATLRSWTKGYFYPIKDGRKFFKPVFSLPEPEIPLLSYTNLVEAFVLSSLRRKHQIDLHKIRKAIENRFYLATLAFVSRKKGGPPAKMFMPLLVRYLTVDIFQSFSYTNRLGSWPLLSALAT